VFKNLKRQFCTDRHVWRLKERVTASDRVRTAKNTTHNYSLLQVNLWRSVTQKLIVCCKILKFLYMILQHSRFSVLQLQLALVISVQTR